MNRPGKTDKYVVFEGLTEEVFFKLLYTNFESKYNLYFVNAKGKDKVIEKYKNIKKKNNNSDVIVMYDLDGEYCVDDIIKSYREKGIKISKPEIGFINPKFEIILILLKEQKIPVDHYSSHIKRLYGIENWRKELNQIERVMNQISKEEIIVLINRMDKLLSSNDKEIRSTNYHKIFKDLFNI